MWHRRHHGRELFQHFFSVVQLNKDEKEVRCYILPIKKAPLTRYGHVLFILCNRLGRNCHQSHATTTTYQTTRAIIKRQPGAAHVPSTQRNSRNNPSIRWARDVVFHYTTPRTVGSSLTKQWAREQSRRKLARLSGLSTDVRNDAGEMIPEEKQPPQKRKERLLLHRLFTL